MAKLVLQPQLVVSAEAVNGGPKRQRPADSHYVGNLATAVLPPMAERPKTIWHSDSCTGDLVVLTPHVPRYGFHVADIEIGSVVKPVIAIKVAVGALEGPVGGKEE